VGKPIPQEIAKLMLITKVHALAQGFSGIAPDTLTRIIWHIDNDIIPHRSRKRIGRCIRRFGTVIAFVFTTDRFGRGL
jgi:hypothetical protein